MNIRSKIAAILFTIFLTSRALDVCATRYYSPNLNYEANPLVLFLGASWSSVYFVVVVLILLCLYWCYKLAWADYTKPAIEEKIEVILFKQKYKTAKQRYIFDFSTVFAISFCGFGAALFWILIHQDKQSPIVNTLANDTGILGLPLYSFILLIVGFGLGYIVGKWVYQRFLLDSII